MPMMMGTTVASGVAALAVVFGTSAPAPTGPLISLADDTVPMTQATARCPTDRC